MALNEIQQLHQLMENSKHVLIVPFSAQNIDNICAALAYKLFLEKQHKQTDVVIENFVAPKNLGFVKGVDDITPQITHLQKFIIKINVANIKLDTLSYDVKDNQLSIYLTPKQGIISKDQIRTAQSNFKYDLIIAIGAQDLEAIGNIFFNNTDLFYRVPVVNFDNNPANEHYGQLNFTDITATSCSEIIFKTISQLGEAYLDEHIATALLTGMISQTKSFKTANITPFTLNIAGQLMNAGADREKIIKNLYKTRSISSLKIWGRALTQMQSDPKLGLVWTALTREDFTRAGANEDELKDLIDELISSAPEAKIIAIIYESTSSSDNSIKGFISVDRQYDAKELLADFHPEGNKKTATFCLENKTLKEAEEEVVGEIKQKIETRN